MYESYSLGYTLFQWFIVGMNREILENTGVLCYYESVIDRYDNWFVFVQRPTVIFIVVVTIVFDYSNEFLKERTKKKIEYIVEWRS